MHITLRRAVAHGAVAGSHPRDGPAGERPETHWQEGGHRRGNLAFHLHLSHTRCDHARESDYQSKVCTQHCRHKTSVRRVPALTPRPCPRDPATSTTPQRHLGSRAPPPSQPAPHIPPQDSHCPAAHKQRNRPLHRPEVRSPSPDRPESAREPGFGASLGPELVPREPGVLNTGRCLASLWVAAGLPF